jgi:pimeloyl-ACP methyl ester carboxylesterase
MKKLLLVLGLAVATAAGARADDKIGIVLMHGKQGAALGQTGITGNKMPMGARLVADLKDAGYLIATPEMCWSGRRGLDKTFQDCLAEIDAAVADLRRRGATRIIVGGQSQGGNAAIAYGALHPELAGIIGMAPADDPTTKLRRPDVRAAVTKAQRLLDEGKGDERTSFDDVNTGPNGVFSITITTTPKIFVSFYAPDSPAVIPPNAARVRVPLLWIAGDDDSTQRGGPSYAFDKAPPNPMNRYVAIHANHSQTPDAGRQAILAWLSELAKAH